MKNLIMPIIIGVICCMLLGYTNMGKDEVVNHREIVTKQILLSHYSR